MTLNKRATIKYRMTIVENTDALKEGDSVRWSGWSDIFSYDPNKSKLIAPSNPLWSTTEPNMATWTNAAGVKGYDVELYRNGTSTGVTYIYTTTPCDMSDDIADIDENAFQFRVRSKSLDLNKNAHSDWTELSNVLDTSSVSQTAESVIADAAAQGDPSIITNQFQSDLQKEVLRNIIQGSTAV